MVLLLLFSNSNGFQEWQAGVKVCAYKVVEELLSAGRSAPASLPASAGMSNSESNTASALQKSADTVARAVFKSEKGRRIY